MRIILFFLIISFFLWECKKPYKDGGIIVSEMDLWPCINIPPIQSVEEYVINDSTSYQQLQQPSGNSQCSTYTLPYIDFNQYTLLGKYTEGGCKANFYRQVLRDDQSKEYKFTVYVRKRICFTKKEAIDMNWVLVPKLPQGYSVTFHIDKK